MKKAEFQGLYLKLNTVNDKDIIDRLKTQDNKQGYIKELIRIDTSLDGIRNAFIEGKTVEHCHKAETEK